MSPSVPEISAFVAFLEKERNDSPHTVKAYERDVKDFAAFCGRYYGGSWSWAGVDRLAIRGWLGALQQRGLAKRSAARALSALRTFYRFLAATQGQDGSWKVRSTKAKPKDDSMSSYWGTAWAAIGLLRTLPR